jgi:hypothetical protein
MEVAVQNALLMPRDLQLKNFRAFFYRGSS